MDDVNTLCDAAGEQTVLQILIFVYMLMKKNPNAFILVVFHEISHHQHIFRTCLMKYKTNSLKVFILYDVTWLFSDLWHSDGVGQQMSQF